MPVRSSAVRIRRWDRMARPRRGRRKRSDADAVTLDDDTHAWWASAHAAERAAAVPSDTESRAPVGPRVRVAGAATTAPAAGSAVPAAGSADAPAAGTGPSGSADDGFADLYDGWSPDALFTEPVAAEPEPEPEEPRSTGVPELDAAHGVLGVTPGADWRDGERSAPQPRQAVPSRSAGQRRGRRA